MKRYILAISMLLLFVSCTMAKNPESEAKKRAKQLAKAGWVLYDPSGLTLDKQILAEVECANMPSKYNPSRQAYMNDTQIAKDRTLESALKKARNACYSSLASLLQTKVGQITAEQTTSTSTNAGNVQTKQEILNILGTRSRECLRNIEDGLIIYRKVKDEYEVQLTLRLNTDMLYE